MTHRSQWHLHRQSRAAHRDIDIVVDQIADQRPSYFWQNVLPSEICGSPRFAEPRDAETPPPLTDPSRHKTVDHPAVGPITLDCDTLFVALDDVRITVYTAEPGHRGHRPLTLTVVLGTQSLQL